jgi:hypothetical protein
MDLVDAAGLPAENFERPLMKRFVRARHDLAFVGRRPIPVRNDAAGSPNQQPKDAGLRRSESGVNEQIDLAKRKKTETKARSNASAQHHLTGHGIYRLSLRVHRARDTVSEA